MDRKTIMNERHSALEALEGLLQEELIAAKLNAAGDAGGVEVLTVIFPELGLDGDGAVGELFFLPVLSEDAAVQHFNTVITIAGDIDEEQLPLLYEAISYINFRLPCGAFALDRETLSLVFKLSVPLPIDLKGDDLLKEMNICSGNAVAVADRHMDILLRMTEGEAGMEDVTAAWGS